MIKQGYVTECDIHVSTTKLYIILFDYTNLLNTSIEQESTQFCPERWKLEYFVPQGTIYPTLPLIQCFVWGFCPSYRN